VSSLVCGAVAVLFVRSVPFLFVLAAVVVVFASPAIPIRGLVSSSVFVSSFLGRLCATVSLPALEDGGDVAQLASSDV
jgi:hypothetical protein